MRSEPRMRASADRSRSPPDGLLRFTTCWIGPSRSRNSNSLDPQPSFDQARYVVPRHFNVTRRIAQLLQARVDVLNEVGAEVELDHEQPLSDRTRISRPTENTNPSSGLLFGPKRQAGNVERFYLFVPEHEDVAREAFSRSDRCLTTFAR